MSHQAVELARRSRAAKGSERLVLFVLASYAGGGEDPFDYAFPAVSTIAADANLSARSVHVALRKLEASGEIERTGEKVWSTDRRVRTIQYRIICPSATGEGVTPMSSPEAQGRYADLGEIECSSRRDRVQTSAHNSSVTSPNPSESKNAQARARKSVESPPPDFPKELRPHARAVYPLLVEVAEQHGAREVTALALGRLLMAYPRHPLVATAQALHVWAADPPRPIKDVVATYRSFLSRERPLQATERLDAGGAAAAPSPRRPGRKLTAMEQAQANLAEIARLRAAGEIE